MTFFWVVGTILHVPERLRPEFLIQRVNQSQSRLFGTPEVCQRRKLNSLSHRVLHTQDICPTNRVFVSDFPGETEENLRSF